MMLCLNIVMTTTMNGFIENTKFEYVEGANKTDCHLSICGRPPVFIKDSRFLHGRCRNRILQF